METLHQLAGTQSYGDLIVKHMAEYLDLALRAHNSSIQERVTKVLCERYEVQSLVLRMATLQIPVQESLQASVSRTTGRVWMATVWQCTQYPEGRSKEMRASLIHRGGTYRFTETKNWIDIALQILNRIRDDRL